jgi:D-tyrosyl-tRNA(Tyr) deacylase
MRTLLQRVSSASVTIEESTVGEIDQGLLIYVCAVRGDDESTARTLAVKIAKIRIFQNDDGHMNRSIRDIGGKALIVSQFTLAADTSQGNRPGFSGAASPDIARELYEHFCACMKDEGIPVETGRFGADMAVQLINDGPVTIWLDSEV